MRIKKKQQPADLNRHRVVRDDQSMPSAFSYHTKRSDRPNSGQGRVPTINMDRGGGEKNKQNSARRVTVLGFIGVIFILIIVLSWVGSDANVVIVQPDGFNYSVRSTAQYQQVITNAIDSSIYNHFKMTINTSSVSNSIKQRYPEVAFSSITVPFIGTKPMVYIQLQRPALFFATNLASYVLDSDGVIISSSTAVGAPQSQGLNIVNYAENEQLKPGDQVLTQQNVAFIETVAQALKAKNIGISKMQLAPAAAELDVYITAEPYYVKFNIYQNDSLQQVGTYLATIGTLKQQGKTPAQYIDVRVDGRAYYK